MVMRKTASRNWPWPFIGRSADREQARRRQRPCTADWNTKTFMPSLFPCRSRIRHTLCTAPWNSPSFMNTVKTASCSDLFVMYDRRKTENAAHGLLPEAADSVRMQAHIRTGIGDFGMNFFHRVYDIVRSIPSGAVASYGQVAFLAGNRHMARQVGWALHSCPEDVPWHRVVKKDGSLPEFSRESSLRQRLLLEQEGILFDEDGRVSRIFFGGCPDDGKKIRKSCRTHASKHDGSS